MGGGARGLAHIGVLEVLIANGLAPEAIAGTSMGALVGGFYAAGIAPREMESLITEMGYARLIDKPLLGRRPSTMTAFFQRLMIETSRDRLLKRFGVDRGDRVEAIIKEIVGDRRIEGLKIPFACNAVDIISGREVAYTRGLLRHALRASMAYPLVFEPVRRGRMLLVDGGLVNAVPVDLARRLNASPVIAPDVDRSLRKFPAASKDNVFKLLTRMSQIVFTHQDEARLKSADFSYPVGVNVDDFDFSNPRSIIARGRKATEKNLDAIRALIEGR